MKFKKFENFKNVDESYFQGSRTVSTKVLERRGDLVLKLYEGETTTFILENERRNHKLFFDFVEKRKIIEMLQNN